MKRPNKIYPNSGDPLFGTISDVLEEVEADMKKIQEAANVEISKVYEDVDKVLQPPPKKAQKLFQESDGEEDDVKFSFEIAREAKNQQTVAELSTVKRDLQDYKGMYVRSVDKLKEADIKSSEVESKLEALQSENARLKKELGSRAVPANKTSGPGNEKINAELQKRTDEIRRALLNDNDEGNEMESLDTLLKGSNTFAKLIKLLRAWVPFKRDINVIQARFGSAVASYFIFCRVAFFLMSGIGAVLAIFATFHIINMSKYITKPVRFISGNSFLPSFMLYSSFRSGENILYANMVVLSLLITLVFLCYQLVMEDREMKTLEAFESISDTPFSKNILCAWDCSLTTKLEIDDLKSDLSNRLTQQLEEKSSLGKVKLRSNYEALTILLRRICGCFLHISVSLVAFALIIYFTINSKAIANSIPNIPGIGPIGSLISPFVLQAINTAMPIVLNLITQIEMWDSGLTVMNVVLMRIYISSTLNSLILAFTYLLLADPYLLASNPTLRSQLELPLNSNYNCRIDQVADALFSLMILTWVFRIVFVVANPFFDYVSSKVLKRPWVKAEFQVPEQMVKLLSYLGIIFITLPFAPLSIIFVPIGAFINFKWEKYWLKRLYSKPKRPWKAHRAALIYVFFFFTTFVLLGVTIGAYFLYTKTLAKSCKLQDENVELCRYGYLDLSSDTCTVDPNSKYYSLFGKSSYPAAICDTACGAFVDDSFPMNAIQKYVEGFSFTSFLWLVLFNSAYLPWTVIIILSLFLSVNSNTIYVLRFAAFNKEMNLEQQIQTITAEKKKQESIIDKLKKMVTTPLSETPDHSITTTTTTTNFNKNKNNNGKVDATKDQAIMVVQNLDD